MSDFRYKKTLCAVFTIAVLCLLSLLLNIKPHTKPVNLSSVRREIIPISNISKSEDFSDLQFLKKELSGKQIVMMGEMLHSDGGTFLAKSRLIRFLNKECGYDVILFEAGRYDMFRFENDIHTNRIKADPANYIYPFWSSSVQMLPLWNYIRHSGMKVGGIDVQCTGSISDTMRRELLFRYLKRFDKNPEKKWSYFYKYMGHLKYAQEHWYLIGGNFKKTYYPDRICADADSIVKILSDHVYASYVNGIKNVLLYSTKYEVGESLRERWRDSLMTENFVEIMQSPEYKDRKVIIWCANLHAFNDNSQFYGHSFINFGERIKKLFGNKIYTIIFTSYSRHDKDDNQIYDVSGFNTIEYALHSQHKPYLYIKSLTDKVLNPVACRANQDLAFDLNLGKMADALFFIDSNENAYYPKQYHN